MHNIWTAKCYTIQRMQKSSEEKDFFSILAEFENLSLAYPSYTVHCLNRALMRIRLMLPSSLAELPWFISFLGSQESDYHDPKATELLILCCI